ncbi:hypothetical protein [Paraburkholderia caledonica]|jgi:hypothetical protein|uniref:hypothetical protein n=1 Tax=Paraburkholderia caledonica TaxID=134536 RepID=UPI0038B7B130
MFFDKLISSLRRATRLVTSRSRAHQSANGGTNGKGQKSRYAEEHRIIEASGLFDGAFYRRTYPDVANAGIDPLEHYVEWGGREGRRPNPTFDPQWYTSQYADVLESGIHPLVHYLTIGRNEGRRCGLDSRILSVVGAMYQEAGVFEPAIALDPALASPHMLGVHGGGQHWPVLRVWRALFESLDHPFRCIIFAAGPFHSGVKAMVINTARVAIEAHGPDSTLVVFTDHEVAGTDCPSGIHTRCLSDFGEPLTRIERASIVEKLILAVRPKAVLTVDSVACWDAIIRKGGALRLATDLYAYVGRSDHGSDSRSPDFAHTHFRESLPFLRTVYFETLDLQERLASEYGLPPSLMGRLAHIETGNSQTAFIDTLQASPSFID